MLKYLSILFSAALLAPALRAEQEFVIRQSLSEQFVVYGPKASPIRHFQSQRVPLDSALVAVSCERIKQGLLGELEGEARRPIRFRNRNEGNIYAVLHPKVSQPVVITPIPTAETLNYRIDLPNEIEATRFVDAVVETILLERVNRHSANNLTQVPRWLSQGLAAQVQEAAPEMLVLEQHSPITRIKQRLDPIAEARQSKTNISALTFDELSWPEQLSPEQTTRYRRSAQLFVAELLRLKNGPACLRQMIDALPNHPRWQVAFMQGFGSHFQKLVDVEKWWELTLVNLTGGGPGQLLSHEQSLERIDTALQVPVQVFQDFNAAPKRNNLGLQEIVSDWEPRRQKPALEKVASQLRILRSRVEPEMVPLLDQYRATLENYLQNNEKNLLQRVFLRGNAEDLKKITCDQLEKLDQQRTTLRARLHEKPKPSTREEAILSALEVAGQRKQ